MSSRNRPTNRPAYDFNKHGQSTRFDDTRLRIVKSGSGVIVKKPSWNGTETIFRPYPSLDYENRSQVYPYRWAEDDCFGNWIRRYDCAWQVGDPAVTFLLAPAEATDYSYDRNSTPLGILYNAINAACKAMTAKPEWYLITSKNTAKGQSLKRPSECFLIQGCLGVHNSKPTAGNGFDPIGLGNNKPCILALSSAVGQDLVAMLNEERADWDGEDPDFEKRYVYGDPVSLTGGRFIHFFQKGYDPRQKYAAAPVGGSFGAAPNANQTRGSSENGFGIYISDNASGASPVISADMMATVADKWRDWEDVLFFPTYEEQAHILGQAFPASAIVYAFHDYPNWISEDVRKKSVEAVSAPVPGTVPGQQQGGNQTAFGQVVQPPSGMNPFGGVPAASVQKPAQKPVQSTPTLNTPVVPSQTGDMSQLWQAMSSSTSDSVVPDVDIGDDEIVSDENLEKMFDKASEEPVPAYDVAALLKKKK
jgi:hypothetical protein